MFQRSLLLIAALSALVVPVSFVACGGGSSGASADGGGAMTDGAVASDGGGPADGGLPEGSTPPQGTQIVMGKATVMGVTTDDNVVYDNSATGTLNVVPVTGGAPTLLGPATSDVLTGGPVVVSWTGANQSTNAAAMSVWTKAGGTKSVSAAALDPTAFQQGVGQGLVDVSSDGTKVLFFDNVTAATGDLTVVSANGTGKTVVIAGVHLDNQDCQPYATFVGSDIVAAYCMTGGGPVGGAGDAGPGGPMGDAGVPDGSALDAGAFEAGASDGGALESGAPDGSVLDGGALDGSAPDGGDGGTDVSPPIATLTVFSGAGWATQSTLSIAAEPSFVADRLGREVLYVEATGVTVYDLASTTKNRFPGALGGVLSSDGSKIVFVSATGDLETAPASSPGGATMLASGFQGVVALSPNDQWVIATKTAGRQLGDLSLASATGPGAPTTLDAMMNAELFGQGFTADSSHALWNPNVDETVGIGDFDSLPTTGGGMPTTLAVGVWLYQTTTGAKVVLSANCNCSSSGQNRADLETVDTSSHAMPRVLATQADATFFLTHDKAKVVYSWNVVSNSMAGVWVAPLP